MEPVLYSIIGILASALLSGTAAWLMFGRDRMTRPEVERHVQDHSPWTKDKGEVRAMLRANADAIDRLDGAVSNVSELQREMLAELRSLGSRMDEFMSQ